MSDLISREALIKELETFDEEFEFHIDEVYVLIANAPAIEQCEAVTKLWESLGRWSAFLAKNGEQAELSPPSWLIDAVKKATSPISQNEQHVVVGFIDEADGGIFGDVQNGIAEGLCKVGDLLYTSPKQIPDGWKPLYTTPQHPQEQGELVKKAVADALEEAAKICDGYERYYSDIAGIAEDASVQLPCLDKALMAKECSESIRALIKRNAEECQ